MKIATLGPEGTFSHEAVLKYSNDAEILFNGTIMGIFESVAGGKAKLGIVPIENSVAGTVGQTLDCLVKFGIKIRDEMILPIRHHLAGFGNANDIRNIRTLYVHPQTYEQCELFVKRFLPKAEIIETSSNGKSAEIVAKSKDKASASIIPKTATSIYGLRMIKKDVQDSRFNVTRFFAVGNSNNKKTGYDRTSIAVYPQIDKPGLLYNMLGEFAKRKINLTKIESRPSKGKLGDYIFYIDFQGHKSEKHVNESLKVIEGSFFVNVLGSYPRKY
ncbi:prephenate dehydratase [Candidatus Woesearchaeota archaeon]|nr:prephenate dehydratase [Candidatus Woesearchaeota archaeon]